MTQSFSHEGLAFNVLQRGSGKPVMFQHGLCGDSRQTAEAFPEDPRWCLHTLECRGHGKSPIGALDALSIPTFAGDVAAYIEKELHEPVVMGGISMGAAISLRLAVTRPELVRALILVRPAWIAEPAPINHTGNIEVGRLLTQFPNDVARIAFENGTVGSQIKVESPDNYISLTGFFAREPQAETSALLLSIGGGDPGVTRDQLAALDLPVLVVGTDADVIHPRAMAEELGALIPKARVEIIYPKGESRARHINELHRTITTFLQECAP